MSVNPKAKAQELNLHWPTPPNPVANYIPARIAGDQVYVSGQLPMVDGELHAQGPVPESTSMERAQSAARQATLQALAAVGQAIDEDWSRFDRMVRLGVFVNAAADFELHHKVANGASELLDQLLGEAGQHARAAVGVPSLPLGATVEVELIARLTK